MADDLLISKSS